MLTLQQAGRIHEDRAQHIAQHMHADDGEGAGAAHPRCLDVVELAHLRRHAFRDPHHLRHEHQRQRD
jgi:hypothetical protein